MNEEDKVHHTLFQGFSQLADIHDFWFLQFQPELLTSIVINCQRFDYSTVILQDTFVVCMQMCPEEDYSAVIFFRTHLLYVDVP